MLPGRAVYAARPVARDPRLQTTPRARRSRAARARGPARGVSGTPAAARLRSRGTFFAFAARSASARASPRATARGAPGAAEPLGQLITARLTEQLILRRVDLAGLLQDLLRDLLIAAVLVVGRRRRDLAAIDSDNPDLDQAGLRAQPQAPR